MGSRKITLDQFLNYEINIFGHLQEQTFNLDESLTISLGFDKKGEPTSKLKCRLDQASLHGLLRRLYFSGIPLISVHCLDIEKNNE